MNAKKAEKTEDSENHRVRPLLRSNKTKFIAKLMMLYAIEIPLVSLPLVGIYWCGSNNAMQGIPFFVVMFFVSRKIAHYIEDKVGIRSPGNPNSRYYGSGLVFEAPWMRKGREIKEAERIKRQKLRKRGVTHGAEENGKKKKGSSEKRPAEEPP